jgi:hypothetical protein
VITVLGLPAGLTGRRVRRSGCAKVEARILPPAPQGRREAAAAEFRALKYPSFMIG